MYQDIAYVPVFRLESDLKKTERPADLKSWGRPGCMCPGQHAGGLRAKRRFVQPKAGRTNFDDTCSMERAMQPTDLESESWDWLDWGPPGNVQYILQIFGEGGGGMSVGCGSSSSIS